MKNLLLLKVRCKVKRSLSKKCKTMPFFLLFFPHGEVCVVDTVLNCLNVDDIWGGNNSLKE